MKYYYLPLLAATMLSAQTPTAEAVTVDDLVGKPYAILFLGNVAEDGLGIGQASGVITKGSSDNQIVLNNFLGDFDLPMTLSNDQLTITNNVSLGAGNYSGLSCTNLVIKRAVRFTDLDDVYYDNGVQTFDYGYRHIAGNMTSTTCTFDPEVRCNYFRFNDPFVPMFTIPELGGDAFLIYGKMDLFVYDSNATANAYINDEIVATFPMRLTFDTDEDGDIVELLNWFGYGVGYENDRANHSTYINNPVANIYDDGTLDIPVMPISGYIESGCSWFSPNMPTWYIAWTDLTKEIYKYYSTDINASPNKTDEQNRVKGTWSNGDVHHTHPSDVWVTNDGLQTTQQGPREFTFITPALTKNDTWETIDSYDKIVITEDSPRDVTHGVSLDIYYDYHRYDDNGNLIFGLQGFVTPNANNQYVSDYDLYIVPGQHSSVKGLTQDADCGLEGATLIPEDHYSQLVMNEGDNGFAFQLEIPESELVSTDPNHKYSFFIKTNYLTDTALAPTFHSLYSADLPTSVDSVPDGDTKAYAADGRIVIEAAPGTAASVYSLTGAAIYDGPASDIEVAAGAYIVKVGDKTFKLIVK